MVIKQYPHTIIYTPAVNSTRDTNGNWVGGSPGAEVSKECRAEPASGNGYLISANGSRVDFSWIVYLPVTSGPIPEGASVQVKNGETVIATDTVKRFYLGQLNARVWL